MDTFNFRDIHRALTKHYNLDELETLCADLGVRFENLGGTGLDGKARELIYLMKRRNRLRELEPHLYGVKVIEEEPPTGSAIPQTSDGADPIGHPATTAGAAKTTGASSAEPRSGKDADAATADGLQKGQKVETAQHQTGIASAYWIRLCGTIVLGLVLLAILIWAFQYAPNSLPDFKQRMLAIACALVAGLFTFFFTGSIGLDSKSLTTPWGELSLTATGGVAVFVLVLIWWLSPITPIPTDNTDPHPTPSPAVTGGNRASAYSITPLAPLHTQSRINKVALSRDGELLASAEESGAVQVWRVKSGGAPKELAGSEKPSPARCVAIGPNDQTIGAGSADGKIRIWLTSDDDAPILIASHTNAIYELYFSPDGQRLVATGADSGNVRVARLWKFSGKPELLKSFRLPNLDDQILSVSADLLVIMIYSPSHKRVELWSLPDSKLQIALNDSNFEVKTGAFSQDGQFIALGSDTGDVGLWQVKDGNLLRKLTGASERVVSIALRPDGQLIGAGYPDGSVYLWNANEGKPINSMREHTQRVFSLAFSANGRLLASGGEDGKIQLWEIKDKS